MSTLSTICNIIIVCTSEIWNLTQSQYNLTLSQVKYEIKSESCFSNVYTDDVAATQQIFRCLLPDPPMPGYVQYFVQDLFIIHMYSYKQTKLLKLMDRKDIVLNFDATGSLISKPPSCTEKIFHYSLTIQHPEFSSSPFPSTGMIMISSDHSTAEMLHFLINDS